MYRTNIGDIRTNQKSKVKYMENSDPAPPQQKVTGADLAQVTFCARTPAGPAVVRFFLLFFSIGPFKT